MPSTDTKPELTAKASMAQPVSQPAVYANGLKKELIAITQEASRNLNIKMNRLLPALTKKLFQDLQETSWKG
jgi:hypothetical protein